MNRIQLVKRRGRGEGDTVTRGDANFGLGFGRVPGISGLRADLTADHIACGAILCAGVGCVLGKLV
jgi:hypothetical protein